MAALYRLSSHCISGSTRKAAVPFCREYLGLQRYLSVKSLDAPVPSSLKHTSTLRTCANAGSRQRDCRHRVCLPPASKADGLLQRAWHNKESPAFSTSHRQDTRCFSTQQAQHGSAVRNVGISAHIDSGKTTLTERILFYSGRIKSMHEVRGTDGVGATMDSMELEREKGITIQSAATYCSWEVAKKSYNINIIDTPGHVDFTIEVERALRVLDGAILVCCGVSGVQSQTMTVDRQMRRYEVPRVVFVNKLDRDGADPSRTLLALRRKLGIKTCALQVPIGLEAKHTGVIDVVSRRRYLFEGKNGQIVMEDELPIEFEAEVEDKRAELVEVLADIDDEFAECYLEKDTQCTSEEVHAAIRRQTLQRRFVPLLMGSAKANKGVQPLLDAVCRYLPSPGDKSNVAFDQEDGEKKVELLCDPSKSLVAMAFKIQDLPVGQLTYLRLYRGKLKKGDGIFNMSTGKKTTVKKILRMHADDLKEIDKAFAGDIVALGGLECNSGTTFTDGQNRYTLDAMFVPKPVVSLGVKSVKREDQSKFQKAIQRFQREDPTFRVTTDEESKELVFSGMGELHLDIYVERLQREYGVSINTGEPKVNFRETVTQKVDFNYFHKKQTGGSGQYGRVTGYLEPIEEDEGEDTVKFRNDLIGNDIPPNYIPSVQKGFLECSKKGSLSGHPIINTRFVLTGGASHDVDSSDLAFRLAAHGAFRESYPAACPVVLEPIMKVQVIVPSEFQAAGLSSINKRKGTITNSVTEGASVIIDAEVALKDMFGYITELRSCTQGQGEFQMEFDRYQHMSQSEQDQLVKKHQEKNLQT